MMKELSREDIEKLSRNCSVGNKGAVAHKISVYYNGSTVTEQGKELAESIFKIMVNDVEVKVRELLADSLKNCHNLPQEIVQKLVNDKNSVSVPFIKYYQDLTNDDMLIILHSHEEEKQIAVAGRANLGIEISNYIAEKCQEKVVGILISNPTAEIGQTGFDHIVNRYPQNNNINEKLVSRNELPTGIILKIVDSLSTELRHKLILQHQLPNNLASDIIEEIKDKLTLQVSDNYSSDKKIEEFVKRLFNANRLTPSLLVRSVCSGDLKFFEYALVYLSGTSLSEVRKTLFNSHLDFMTRNLLRKAAIPKIMFPAIFNAFKVIKDIRFDCYHKDRQSFSNTVIERLLSVGSNAEELSEEDVNYLISKIR